MIEIIERHCEQCEELLVIRLIGEKIVGATFIAGMAGDYWLCHDCNK